MANYKRQIYKTRKTIEVEEKHKGNYGARGKKRRKRRKATPEDIARQNQWNAEKKLRRKLNTYFGPDDWHVILTYRKEDRLSVRDSRKAIGKLLDKLRRAIRKMGYEFRFVLTTEYENKAIHHHLVLNNIAAAGTDTAKLVKRFWTYGRPKFVLMDDNGEYKDLAEYIIKETSKSFKKEGNTVKQRYSCSRNMDLPEPEEEDMYYKEFKEEPKPRPGYYIDKSSIVQGINEITGRPYRYYTMIMYETGRVP